MDKSQKQVTAYQLKKEKKAINDLKDAYEDAIEQIDQEIQRLMGPGYELTQSKVYQIAYQKQMKAQLEVILDKMNANNYQTISEYINGCYEDGWLATFYNIKGQGIPIVAPIDQDAVLKAVSLDSKLSKPLYEQMGINVKDLKKSIAGELSRGLASGLRYEDISRNIANQMSIGLNKAIRIARTEGHRVTCQATMDAMNKAKDAGVDVVKQWDSALDRKTRPSHQRVDGEIREMDEPFSNGLMFPGDPKGTAAEVVNCRCVLLERARWALDAEDATMQKWDGENGIVLTIKEKNYEKFKEAYKNTIQQGYKIDDLTASLINAAKRAEPQITENLLEIVGSTHGTIDYKVTIDEKELSSLDFKLKGYNSLKRKITSDFSEGNSLMNIESHIYDVVRYTDLNESVFFTNDYYKVKTYLENKGYKIVRVKNTIWDEKKVYKGLNTVVQSPDGYKFELQFHTPESLDIKEKIHVLYEKARLDTTTAEEKKRLETEMYEISRELEKIPNSESIANYNELR